MVATVASAVNAAESPETIAAMNTAACVGFLNTMDGNGSEVDLGKVLKDAERALQKAATEAAFNKQKLVATAEHTFRNRKSVESSTILYDCIETVQAILNASKPPFKIDGKEPKLGNVALGDRSNVCDGHEIAELGQGKLRGCEFGRDTDRLQIALDAKGAVVQVERKLYVNYRRMDWQKFVTSAQAYGSAPIFNLKHWIVGYGDNIEVTGAENKPSVTWKSSGRGLLFHGIPCPQSSCDVEDTNVQVTITLRDSDWFNLAVAGETIPDERESLAKIRKREQQNLALVEVITAINAENASRREAASALERQRREEREKQVADRKAEEHERQSKRQKEEAERKAFLANASWMKVTESPADGSLVINGKKATISNVALGDSTSACPTTIERKLLDKDATSLADVLEMISGSARYIANVCAFGSATDQTLVFYDENAEKVVRVYRRVIFDQKEVDSREIIGQAQRTFGPGAFTDDTQAFVAYGTSFDVEKGFFLDSGHNADGRGLLIVSTGCIVNFCRSGPDSRYIMMSDMNDTIAFKKMVKFGEAAALAISKDGATKFKF